MDDPISRLEAIFEAADALLAAGANYRGAFVYVRSDELDRLRYYVSLHKQALSPQEPPHDP